LFSSLKVLLVLDACFSGHVFNTQSQPHRIDDADELIQIYRSGKFASVSAMTACSEAEYAMEGGSGMSNGFFTRSIEAALNTVDRERLVLDDGTDNGTASKHLVVRPATTDPVTDLMNQQQSTHECRLKFRALGKDRITTLFTRKGRSSSAILPENVLWQLFSRLNIQKPLFQTIFNELCLVDHDTSDDDSGTVELVDFLDWCWSDEAKVGAEVEESKRPTVAHSHLPSKILNVSTMW
jgi:hypothetical protein